MALVILSRTILRVAAGLTAAASFLGTAAAQVVLDGKFGASGPLLGPNYNITADLGATRGNNLFHSFSQFDLNSGDIATFSGPAHIQNVLSRVTGGAPSSIDGALRSQIPGANFYFINPSGVIFGPHANIDVSGAFAASTANYLRLADDAKFVAALDADDSLLSSAPVAAFGFLEGANGAIEVRGRLRSPDNAPLSVIGSSVLVAEGAYLEAPGGQISLIGVAAPGEVTPVIGSEIKTASLPPPDGKVGTVVIRGGRLVVDNARIDASTSGGDIDVATSDSVALVNGGQITTQSAGAVPGGDIRVQSPLISVDAMDGFLATRIAAETYSEDAAGGGGNIHLRSDTLEVKRGGEISVSTYGAADAGTVDIQASLVRIEGSEMPVLPTQISANAAPFMGITFGSGGKISIEADQVEITKFATVSASTLGDANAGSIEIKANSLSVHDGSITTYSTGAGNAGDVRVEAGDMTLDGMFGSITSFTLGLDSTLPAGKGGKIDVTAHSLTLLNDAALAAGTYGDGNGGNVSVTAHTITLDTGHPQPGIFPGISASSGLAYEGAANKGGSGDVFIKAGTLAVRNGMLISTATATTGPGGNVQIDSGAVTLANGSSIQAASEGSGPAGNIAINSSANVELTQNSSITTSALQSSGGNIAVSAANEILLADSQFTARAGPGGGGNIDVHAPARVYLLNSAFDAQAVGDGGNLTVSEPQFFLINDSGLISKSATRNGGNITILSDYFFSSDSLIDASAPFGLPGTVSVSAPNVDLSGSLIALPGALLSAETQLRPDCSVRLSADLSSFVILGRGGLPPKPGGFVPSEPLLTPHEAK